MTELAMLRLEEEKKYPKLNVSLFQTDNSCSITYMNKDKNALSLAFDDNLACIGMTYYKDRYRSDGTVADRDSLPEDLKDIFDKAKAMTGKGISVPRENRTSMAESHENSEPVKNYSAYEARRYDYGYER